MNGVLVSAITAGLIAASAFFVVIEFALLGARRYRLEEQAATSASARAALKGVNELTVMLAGAQLGITVCTFALGAITKPAVDAWLGPVLSSWGIPEWLADGSAFALSLLFVTFLHLVVGEMAPKSWAIAHPETAAKLIGIPARTFVWPFRPLLVWVNRIANRLVERAGVEPVDSAAVGGHDANSLRQLVEHSTQVGALDEDITVHLTGAIELQDLTADDLLSGIRVPSAVAASAITADLWQVATASGHLRILVMDDARPIGAVHVRDSLLDDPSAPVTSRMREVLVVDGGSPVHDVFSTMRSDGVQLAAVHRDGAFVGVITITDIVQRVLPHTA